MQIALYFRCAFITPISTQTHNCLEFISILFKKAHLKKSHRLRKVKNFKYKQLRRFRIIGCILMLTAWTILLYALATVSTKNIIYKKKKKTISIQKLLWIPLIYCKHYLNPAQAALHWSMVCDLCHHYIHRYIIGAVRCLSEQDYRQRLLVQDFDPGYQLVLCPFCAVDSQATDRILRLSGCCLVVNGKICPINCQNKWK